MRFVVYSVVAIAIAVLAVVNLPERTASDVVGRTELPNGVGHVDLLSDSYRLDKVYQSMTGPRSNQAGILLCKEAKPDETIWLTGVETKVVDAKNLSLISNEFFCHGNLTLNPETTNPETHNNSFQQPAHMDWRFFTLVPGRMSIQLPKGFGVPLKNQTLLDYFSMSLNQNHGEPERHVRMRTRVSYQRSVTGHANPQSLFRRSLYIYQQHQLSADSGAVLTDSQVHQGERCAQSCEEDQRGTTPSAFADKDSLHPGASCCVANASDGGVLKQFGEENTIHWMVPPGVHEYRTEVTEQMNLPYDTTAHYVTGHLHPFGTSLRLVDIESGEVVFDITGKSLEDRLGVELMSEIVSQEGIELTHGRRYELIADYDNTSDGPIDAMAILYIYAL